MERRLDTSSATLDGRPYDWRRASLVTSVGASIAIGLTVLLEQYPELGIAVRDPIAVAHSGGRLDYYTGWITFIGVFVWVSAAAACAVAASFTFASRRGRFLAGAGTVSAILAVDDLFMIHDLYLPLNGVPEETFMLVLVLLVGSWTAVYLPELAADRDLPMLFAGCALFSVSFVADAVEPGSIVVNEEAAKAAGILCWSLWCWSASFRSLRTTMELAAVTAPAHGAASTATRPRRPAATTGL